MKKIIITIALSLGLDAMAQCPDSTIAKSDTFTSYYSTMPNNGDIDSMTVKLGGVIYPVTILAIDSNSIVFTQSSLDSTSVATQTKYYLNGQNQGHVCNDNSPLPVTWLGVNATTKGKKIMVEWSTAIELNNSHFVVEKYFSHGWDSIGSMKGRGSTYKTTLYNFWDSSPLDGLNVYRVKQIDYDGKFDFSKWFKARYGVEVMEDKFKKYNIIGQRK